MLPPRFGSRLPRTRGAMLVLPPHLICPEPTLGEPSELALRHRDAPGPAVFRQQDRFLHPRREPAKFQNLRHPHPGQPHHPGDLSLALNLALVDEPLPPVGRGEERRDPGLD